jgi:hypothetical protein
MLTAIIPFLSDQKTKSTEEVVFSPYEINIAFSKIKANVIIRSNKKLKGYI